MTKTQKEYIAKQLEIIQEKIDNENLQRYASLLFSAQIDKEVKAYLDRAVTIRMKELNPSDSMVVAGDLKTGECE